MTLTIQTITVPFMFGLTVNCYLVRLDEGFILIDTGTAPKRALVETTLKNAGCQPGDLKLIILTHGDFDHCGNAAYLRKEFGGKVALHANDTAMVENGDMFASRKRPNVIIDTLAGLLFKLNPADRFTPDITFTDGYDFTAEYGFDARVVHLPGHSAGNSGILTTAGDLFCGDLLGNTREPAVWMLVDDKAASQTSVEKLRGLPVTTIYPGHGTPFAIEAFWDAQ